MRERRFRPDRRYREDGYLPPVRAPREAVSCLERLAALASIAPPQVLASRPGGRRRRPRAVARARGTGTPSRRRAGRRAAGRPATRRGAPDRRAAPPPSPPSSEAVRARRPGVAPWSTARSRRSSPWSTSNPASRSALPSEPNVCAYSDADGIDRRRAARSRAVGVRPSSSPSAPELLEQLVPGEKAPREEARGPLRRVPRPEVLDDGLWMDACLRILRELAHRRRPPEPLGGRTELGEDLLVRVAPAHAGAKRRELGLVDPHGSTLA